MGLENVLDYTEGFVARFDRERGRDPGLYYLRVFGEPGGARPWGWRFGGHHVSLNNLVVDGVLVATTPCFLGADPATSPLLGGAVNRPLARVEDLGRDLVRSLRPELADPRGAAAEGAVGLRHRQPHLRHRRRPGDPAGRHLAGRAVPRPGGAGEAAGAQRRHRRDRRLSDADHEAVAYSIEPKGVPAAELDAEQREMLRALLGTYLDRVPAGVSPLHRYDDEAALDAVHFAWAGPTAPGQPHYYRLQGPRLLIEWDNTQRNANHAHSVWRDPTRTSVSTCSPATARRIMPAHRLAGVREQIERPAAEGQARRSPFDHFVEAAYQTVSRPPLSAAWRGPQARER